MVSTSDLLSQKMIRSVFVIIFLLLAGQLPGPPSSVFAAGPPPQESPSESELEEVTLQLRWFHQFQFAGYYAAESQGYYRDAGLKVNIVEGDPSVVVNTYEEVLAGRAQYGASNTEVLLERMAGKPLVVLAAIFQHSPYVMIAPRSSGITNPQDLAGRRINMLLGPRTAEMQATLIREGISLEQVTIVSTPGDFPDYLFDESFDAFGGYETNEPFYLEQAGIPFTLIRPQTYGIDFYGDVLYTSETELAAHPGRVRRFREASLKGWQYAMDHPDEIIDLILTEYGSPKSREHLQYEAEQMREVILSDLVELGHMNPGRWQNIAEIYVELGMAAPGYTLDGFIYNPQSEPDNTRFYVALGIIGGLLLVTGLTALILWLFNRRLRLAVDRQTQEIGQSQAALRQSKGRYRAVWDIAADAMALSDPDGIVIDANPAYLALYGYSASEVIGHSFAIIFPEAQRDWAVEQYQAVFANPEVPPRFKSQIRRSDGTERSVETLIGFVESDGRRRLMLSSVRDISARKQAEAALAESEEKHRLLFENAGMAVGYHTPAGEIIALNKLSAKYLMGEAEDYVGKQMQEVYGEEAGAVYQERIAQAASSDAIRTYEDHVRLPAGERWFLSRYARITNAAGQVTGVEIIAHDITELKQTEQALAESEERHRLLFENAGAGIGYYTPSGEIIAFNKLACEQLAGQPEDFAGKHVQEVFGEAAGAVYQERIAQAASSDAIRTYEDHVRLPVGERWFLSRYVRITNAAGQVTGVEIIAHDITELKLAQTALADSEKNLRALINATEESVLLMEPTGTIIECNEGIARRFGRTRDDLVGTNSADLVDEVVAAHRRQYAEQVIASGQPVRFVDERLGQTIDNSIYPVLDEAGQVVRLAYFGRDITEQVQAEAARRESEAKNKALLEAIPDLMFRLTRDGEIIDFRANYPEELLLEPEQVVGSRLYDTMPPQVCNLIQDTIEQTLETGQMQIFEYQLPVQRGLQDFEARLSVSGEDDVLAIVRNVTDLKQAQQALRESEANLRALIENTDGVIWALDHDYRLIAANSTYYDNMRAAFGRQLQPGDRSLTDDFPADAVAQWRAYYDRALHGERFSVEHGTRYLASKQYFEYWFSPIQTSEGQVIGATIYGRDITGRKVAEEALQASEKRYRHLFENAQDAIMITDDEQRFVEVNPAACALLGYSREELLALGVPDVVPETIRESIRQRGQEFRRAGRQAGEFTLLRKDGSQMETEYRSVANFVPGLSMAFFRDITERKTYEQNLKTALDEKETLLQELYHRTKNNMQVISSMLTLQMEYTEDKLVKRIFEETSNKIKSMAMVHEKLYQSQNLSSIDLAEYIKDLVALLVHSYGGRAYGVKISLDLASVPVLIDIAIPCGLLLNELISNVFKHAFPEGEPGTLNIRLRRLADGAIVLGVSDDGAGFPPDFDVENDGRLGLTLISTLAERQLDGEMTFEGDTGVTFEVRFRDTQYKARV